MCAKRATASAATATLAPATTTRARPGCTKTSGILTAAPDLGADLTDLFNYLTGYSRRVDYRRLIVAPAMLRARVVELIERETDRGERGRIIWKLNNVVDRGIIDALYRASQAGVRIDLVVRAICCLRPGVPGLSEHIQVRSIVGRWLEHSRIYYFGAGGGEYFIGSADMMERNLERRVEAIVPVESPDMKFRLGEILELQLADDERAWALGADGTWCKVPTVTGINAQQALQKLAVTRSRRRREPEAQNDIGG